MPDIKNLSSQKIVVDRASREDSKETGLVAPIEQQEHQPIEEEKKEELNEIAIQVQQPNRIIGWAA